eukprot:scaffold194284_cov27-Tisochrysis_lutea.AAC.3
MPRCFDYVPTSAGTGPFPIFAPCLSAHASPGYFPGPSPSVSPPLDPSSCLCLTVWSLPPCLLLMPVLPPNPAASHRAVYRLLARPSSAPC